MLLLSKLRIFKVSKLRQSGFSVVEVILAVTLFGTIVTVVTGAIIYGRQSNANAGDTNRANLLAEEGCEAVRNIRDAGWSNLPDTGVHYLGQGGGVWTLGSTPEPAINNFDRQINIVAVDDDRKNIACVVSWDKGTVNRQVSIMTRLTNWGASIIPPITPGPIIIAYSKTTSTPFYRTWDGSSWSAEASAGAVTGNINYIVVKSSETRNEAILGVQTSTGAIYVQIWNGSSWGSQTQVGTGSTTTRSFDISYEKNSGEALIAYSPSSGSADFAYRTWDGTTLSGATTVTAPPTTGALNWIELRRNPLDTSDEVAFLMLDANADVYGMRWTGSAWNNMGTAVVWDNAASDATRKGIDIEYEQNSGETLFAWGDSVSTDIRYRTWNGTTLSAANLLDVPAMLIANWIQLAARPGSDEILLGVQDSGADLNTRKWSGSAWDTATQHPEHDASVENVASRNFDITWETYVSNLGKAWLVWGDGATRSEKQWSGTAWGSTNVASGSDDTSFVRLRADPVTGAVFSGIYQCSCSAGSNRDINERHLADGSASWTASNQLWGGPTTADPAHFKVDIAIPSM